MKNKDLEKLGYNIRIERAKRRYSQEKLAELANIQMQHIGKIERGDSDIRFTTLLSIARAFNLSLDELFNMNEPI